MCQRLNLVTQQHHCSLTPQKILTVASPPGGGRSGLPMMESRQNLREKMGRKKHSLKYLLGSIRICSNDWMCACQLTCTRVCAIDQWLGGVSKDDRSHAVEAVFFSVNLQARLLWAHHVVRGVSSVHNQLWDTKLLLQHWEGRTITYRGDKHQQKSVSCLCAALFLCFISFQ